MPQINQFHLSQVVETFNRGPVLDPSHEAFVVIDNFLTGLVRDLSRNFHNFKATESPPVECLLAGLFKEHAFHAHSSTVLHSGSVLVICKPLDICEAILPH